MGVVGEFVGFVRCGLVVVAQEENLSASLRRVVAFHIMVL
jgi:hypothetical protein